LNSDFFKLKSMKAELRLSQSLKAEAESLGFDLFGIAAAEYLEEDLFRMEKWLASGYNSGMKYLEKNNDKRFNPSQLVKGARSVIVVGLNYYTSYSPTGGKPVFSRYSLGTDYHIVLGEKMKSLNNYLGELVPGTESRAFVDTAPVKENVWASRAGLGWIGRNSLVINRKFGSYFFLGTIITTAELDYNEYTAEDHCGNCRECIDACPNGSIGESRTINTSGCISYLTIEHRGKFEESVNLGRNVFGCDICQEVCPWNRKAKISAIAEFAPIPEILGYSFDMWNAIDETDFNRIFNNSPVQRTGFKGFKRNLSGLVK